MATSYGFLYGLPLKFFDSARVLGAASTGHLQQPAQQEGSTQEGTLERADQHQAQQESSPNGQEQASAMGASQPQQPKKQQQELRAAARSPVAWSESGATCIACNIGISGPGFANADEQRAHFKTDWHRYNVKRRLDKRAPLTEAEFERMLEEQAEVSSISGSDTESDDGDDGASSSGDEGPFRPVHTRRQAAGTGKLPQAIYQTADGRPFAVWRCLLLPDHHKHSVPDDRLLPELQRVRRSASKWAVIMLRGGHFAAAVFQMRDTSVARKGHAEEPVAVVAHKTFHRYVVRAGAGGKQSTKDASGKYARSAGSRLRRYNEAALQRDIAQLLCEWRAHLGEADLVFVHAPSSNMRVLLAGTADGTPSGASTSSTPGPVLHPSDPRIRRIPFVTQRPTFSELKRVVQLLGTVYEPPGTAVAAAQAPESGTNEADAEQRAAPPPKTPLAAQPAADARTEAVAGSSGSAAKAEEPALIRAAKAGDAERVARLLEGGHNPTATDAKGRTAYVLAPSKEVRDAMRRFMAREPGRWDYAAAGIPSELSEEREAAQQAKKAEKRARQKAREKEQRAQAQQRKAEAAAAAMVSLEDEIGRAAAEAAALSAKASASKKDDVQSGKGAKQSSQEDAARKREVLAAAAEARMKALQVTPAPGKQGPQRHKHGLRWSGAVTLLAFGCFFVAAARRQRR